MVLLDRLLDMSLSGKGQVVLVTGEAGIGKTRLVQEFGQRARNHGSLFAAGHSYEEEEHVPYASWADALRIVVQQVSAEKLVKKLGPLVAEVVRLVPELAAEAGELGIKGWLAGPEKSFQTLAPGAERFRLFQAITDALVYASKEKPLVILLDDVQWADTASLQLLNYLGRRMKEERIMIIGTYRDLELSDDHPLSRLLLDLNRERVLTKIPLDRLSKEHVASIIMNYLGGGGVAHELVVLIHSRTGGNPFFVEEILRSLLEQGQIYKSEKGWTIREIGEMEIPSSIRALIRQRISRLGEDTARLLSAGATIGTDFEYELLRRVSGSDEEHVLAQLEKAIRAGLVREQRSGRHARYVFADEQIREFLYNDLSFVRRRRLHSQIAGALENLFGNEVERHVEELAYHFILGGDVGKAAKFSLMAGDRAARLHDYPDAVKHYENVLDLIGEDPSNERIAALARLGLVFLRTGEYARVVGTWEEALSVAERLKQSREAARLYSNLAWAHFWLGLDKKKAIENYQKALGILEKEHEPQQEARIFQEIARILVNTLEKEEGLQWCEKAIRIARETGAREILAEALMTRAHGLPPNRNNKSLIFEHLEEALKISLEHDLEDSVCRSYYNLGSASSFITADYGGAKEFYTKGLEYSRKRIILHYEVPMEGSLAAFAYIPLGEWDQALETANQCLRVSSERHDFVWTGMWGLLAAGVVNLLRGNLNVAEEQLMSSYRTAEKAQISEITYALGLALGRLYRSKNDPERAESYFLKSIEIGVRGVWQHAPCEAYFELARFYLAKGDRARASGYIENLGRGAEELDEGWARALASWADGLLAAEEGNWSDALALLRKSSELWRELHHRYYYAHTIFELGRILSQDKDTAGAATCMEEAQTIFKQLGARLDLATSTNERVQS